MTVSWSAHLAPAIRDFQVNKHGFLADLSEDGQNSLLPTLGQYILFFIKSTLLFYCLDGFKKWIFKLSISRELKKRLKQISFYSFFYFFFRFVVWLVFNIIISGGAYHVQNGNISREAVTITSTPIVHNAQTDSSICS